MSDESPATPRPAVLPPASLARQLDQLASENTSSVRAGQTLPWWCGCLAAMLSGLLMAAAFGPQPLHLLAWFAPVPFLVVLPRISAGQAWVFGMLLGLVFYRLGMGWLISIGGYVGAAFMVIYAVWMGLSFRVTWLLMRRFGLAALVWAGPLAFVGQEIIRCEWPARYRFAYLAWGYCQPADGWIAPAAVLGGIHLVSLLLMAFSAALAYGLIRGRPRSFAPAVLAGLFALGVPGIAPRVSPEPSRRVAVACVQAEDLSYRKLLELAQQAACDPSGPRFIVLPEHTICDWASERHPFVRGLAALAREHNAYICVGAHVDVPRGSACDYDNVGLLISPEGRIVLSQAKAVPIPFFRDGNPARRFDVARTPGATVGIYICFDGDFTDIPRSYVDLGAEIFLVPVMNPVRWPTAQRQQQARMACYRAAESARSAVRAASSGISQIIDCDGRVVCQRTQAEGDGYICGLVSPAAARTWFVRGGYVLAKAVSVAYLLAIVLLTLDQWVGARLRGLFR